VSGSSPDAAWIAALRDRADRPPRVPRQPLWWQGVRIGSVEPDWLAGLRLPGGAVTRDGVDGWRIQGDDLTASLAHIADALRDAGAAHAWRDEQLAVTDDMGRVHGTVERAVVRTLGVTTYAVHLAGNAPDGRHWIQRRSRTKANDPGLLDTLMGGMVPAADTVLQALERETWEEAGLRLPQLQDLGHGGRVTVRRPSDSGRGGYMVEHIDWYRCVVPQGVEPQNQDGEVESFSLLDGTEVAARMGRDEFTIEAALVLLGRGLQHAL
jgi:8-oxo-dGTP pyrophosphatase MutT (NUDIX family)